MGLSIRCFGYRLEIMTEDLSQILRHNIQHSYNPAQQKDQPPIYRIVGQSLKIFILHVPLICFDVLYQFHPIPFG